MRAPAWAAAALALLWAASAGHASRGDDDAAEALRKEADALAKQGNLNAALTKMERALALASSRNAKVRLASGMLFARVNSMDRAVDMYRKAIKAGAGDDASFKFVAMAHNNLCVELDSRGSMDEAYDHCKKAAKLPNFWFPHKTLGLIAEKWSAVDEARGHYLAADRIKRNDALRLHAATMLPLVYSSAAELDKRRERVRKEVGIMMRAPSVVITDPLPDLVTVPHFYSAFFGTNNVELYRDMARVLLRSDESRPAGQPDGRLAFTAPFVADLAKRGLTRVPGRKRVRVGFSSMFFREHASGKMIQGVIEGLSRDRFEVIVFCVREKMGQPPYSGEVADRIRNRADKYIELPKPLGLHHMRSRIAAEQCDVLVFAEIGMDPGNYLLAFSRLAPTQVATHGHASTTGIPTLDYFVSYKPFEQPGAQRFYSEKLVTLSDFSPYFKPKLPPAIPSRRELFSELGLGGVVRDDTVVLVCLQTLFKLTPSFDLVFRDILRRLPTARLLLKTFRSQKVNDILLARLQKSMPDVVDRVTVLPGLSAARWFGLLRHGDVVLDSFPFGGYTTTLEALAVGSTPVVTLPHEQMAGRCTKGFFDILGIDDTVASDEREFVDITVRLATGAAFREGVEAQIRTNVDALWERKATILEWEEFLEEVANNKTVTNLHTSRPTWRRIRSKKRGASLKGVA